MKYERHFYESVEAERIPEDPRISDLHRISEWADLDFDIKPDDKAAYAVCWFINGHYVPSWPGNWLTKDDENCITIWEDADFRANFREIEPHLSEVLQPVAEYDEDDLPEWNHRPIVVAYG